MIRKATALFLRALVMPKVDLAVENLALRQQRAVCAGARTRVGGAHRGGLLPGSNTCSRPTNRREFEVERNVKCFKNSSRVGRAAADHP